MRVSRRRGSVRLRLDAVEVELLVLLLDELDALLAAEAAGAGDAGDASDPVRQRLFPDGYRDDPEGAADFRAMTETSLRETKRSRLATCRAELPRAAGAGARPAGQLQFDEQGTERWLTVLNDLRLALGTRLDVRDDDGAVDSDADLLSEQGQPRQVYDWLTALQDWLVRAAMR
jgi:hypothetical protein